MTPRLFAPLRQGGLLRGRVYSSLWLEMLIAATAAAGLMAVVAGAVMQHHGRSQLLHDTEEVQSQLSTGLTSYEPIHNLQRRMLQASASQAVEMALVVDPRGRVLAASDNALVGLRMAQVLQQPGQEPLRALFRDCPLSGGVVRCLDRETHLFLGPVPWIGGDVALTMRPYPLALEGLDRFGDRATLITVTDARPYTREAVVLTLSVFLASLVPLMGGYIALILRLRARLIPELLRLAQVDALSGVFNRRAFLETAEELLRQAAAARRPMALALIDVDHFKQINDSHGHDAGDEVIRRLSQLLERSVRAGDLVGRLGGDEFVILMALPPQAANQIMERILEHVRQTPIPIGAGRSVPVTLSVGVAGTGQGAPPLNQLMADADAALYVAKDRGRNQVANLELELQAQQCRRSQPLHPGSWQVWGS